MYSTLPTHMQGLLWSWYRDLKKAGWTIDANGYTTSFRCSSRGGSGQWGGVLGQGRGSGGKGGLGTGRLLAHGPELTA